MKVLFINPPNFNEIMGNNPAIVESERGCNPPLGILYVAANTVKHTGHNVEVIDTQAEGLSYEALEERIKSSAPDVVGITAMTFTILDVMNTVKIVKKHFPEAKVVLGGPHVHIYPDETIKIEGVDYLVRGEGEYAFVELLGAMGDEEELKKITGIVFEAADGTIVNTGVRPLIDDLDELPFPALDLVPYEKYNSLLARRSPAVTTFTSRGCPFPCTFCDRPQLGKQFRYRSAKSVVDEMEEDTKRGIHEFLVYDDTFTVHKKRTMEICDEIVRRGLDVGWDIRSRVDTVNEEMLKALAKAGCRGIHYGIESGTDKILSVLKKKITIPKAKEVFDMTKREGMQVLAYFMIGCPTETEEDIMETLRVSRYLKPDYIHLTIFTPFPATQLYFDGLAQGVIERDHWREFAANPTSDFTPPHWSENFTREELQALLRKGYKDFYTRPSYIIKGLSKIRTFEELRRKVKAGMKVIGM